MKHLRSPVLDQSTRKSLSLRFESSYHHSYLLPRQLFVLHLLRSQHRPNTELVIVVAIHHTTYSPSLINNIDRSFNLYATRPSLVTNNKPSFLVVRSASIPRRTFSLKGLLLYHQQSGDCRTSPLNGDISRWNERCT